VTPGWPGLGEEYPQETVPPIEMRSPPFSLKYSQLMPKCEDLGGDATSRFDD
jgi:hypothetical protein